MSKLVILELTEAVKRHGTVYPAGWHFRRVRSTDAQDLCRDADGHEMWIPRPLLRLVEEAEEAAVPVTPTLADLVRRGLVRPAAELLSV